MTIAKLPASKDATLTRIRTITRVMDGIIPIPGTGRKIGLDPIIGVLTGGGDSVGFVISTYILLESLRFQLPKATLLRMLSNIMLDAIVGTIPFLGDFFDFVWGANTKNLQLLEAHLETPSQQKAADKRFILLVLIALAGILAIAATLAFLVGSTIGWLWQMVSGGV
jgi:Domain of unknown function (DUF4112)